MTETVEISITVNGVRHRRRVEPRLLLVDFLRHELGLTGTHVGCAHGVCGACSVLVDGASARSCLMLAVQLDGAEVTTVEGLSSGTAPTPLQQAFREHHALQCGYCTPGFLVVATELLARGVELEADDVVEAIAGNLCRCTGYRGIVDAIVATSRTLSGSGPGPDATPSVGGDG